MGLSSDELLNHGGPRLVYGVPLAHNFREYLLGFDARPRYFLPPRRAAAATRQMVRWWAERWLSPRIARDDVLERLGLHTLVRPIRHGARVTLPPPNAGPPGLFDEE